MLKPHIVILGAGFGGVYLAKKLIPQIKAGTIDVTIISRTNYFLFTPLLHEVATGSLSASSVAEPLREVFVNSGVDIIQADIISIDHEAQSVKTSVGVVSYDYLVIATGADTNYYGISGAEKFALPLKNLADATAIRAHVIDAFEHAVLSKQADERAKLLSFVVVGGGPTGVETVSELADFVHDVAHRYYGNTNCSSYPCHAEEVTVSLVNAGPELLVQLSPESRIKATARLTTQNIVIHNNTIVTAVTKDGLQLQGNASIPAHTVIWTAGVKAKIPHFETFNPTLTAGRLTVDQYFKLTEADRIFACGDVAGYVDATAPVTGKPVTLPMLAQVATRQVDSVAYNILASIKGKKLRPFSYHSKGNFVSLGSWFALGEVGRFKFSGKIAWYMWRTIYLSKFASWKKRIRIMFEWTVDLFSVRDITNL